jgi:hypothetical protein
LTKTQLTQRVRLQKGCLIQQESGTEIVERGVAVYTLADPRDVREVRYVGQTCAPQRRYTQHINAARLWLPDELPWWYKAPPGLRPLHEWLRELHRDDYRLPVMLINMWLPAVAAARQMERALIEQYLQGNAALLNVELEVQQRQRAKPRKSSANRKSKGAAA